MKIFLFILVWFFCRTSDVCSQTNGYVLWSADGSMLIPAGKIAPQSALVSGTTIKTINGASVLGSGDLVVTGQAAAWGAISGTLSSQTDLQTALNAKQTTITTGTASQYFKGDLTLATFPTTTAAFASSTDKNFVTDAQAVIIGNTSGTNSGDNAANSTYASDYRAANFVAGTNYLAPAGNGSALTGLTKTQVGLANVDNTSDASKPISTAEQTALNLKANLASPTFTGTVAGITATMVGLGSVDNTSDASKPVSTAQQTALNLKANLASPTFTGTVAGITASMVGLGNVTNESKATMFTSPTFTGTVSGVTATMVGLGNVTNESKATMFTNATFTGTLTLPSSVITNANLAGSIDLTSKVTGVLPFANGGIGSTAATSATTGTMTVNMTTEMITITPTNACTFNGSGGTQGAHVTFVITTSGTSSFVLTWGTNFKTTGTLSTGTTTAKIFTVSFVCTNGTQWAETARTAAQ